MHDSLTGAGTRGYIALDVPGDRLVFLKDCWRPDAASRHPGGEVYMHLHSHNVKYIPTPVGAGDVVDDRGAHTTRSLEFLGIAQWIHYRLILQEVALLLEEYIDSYDLVDVLYCALRGLCVVASVFPVLSNATHVQHTSKHGGQAYCTAT